MKLNWQDKLTLCDIRLTVKCSCRANPLGVRLMQSGDSMSPMTDRFHDDVMSTFGRKLKEAREREGFKTAKDFAEALGVEENRYRHWERGTAQPNLPMLARITRLLKVEFAELIPQAYQKRARETPTGTRAAS